MGSGKIWPRILVAVELISHGIHGLLGCQKEMCMGVYEVT